VLSLALSGVGLFAQDWAKEDMKQAERDTNDAATSTGRATKKTAKKADRAVQHGTHVMAKKARGAEKRDPAGTSGDRLACGPHYEVASRNTYCPNEQFGSSPVEGRYAPTVLEWFQS
jgi:hypothetical protein